MQKVFKQSKKGTQKSMQEVPNRMINSCKKYAKNKKKNDYAKSRGKYAISVKNITKVCSKYAISL